MKKTIFLIVLAFMAGCSRDIPNPASYPALPLAPPTPSNLSIMVGDRILELGWRMSDTTGISNYNIYRSDSAAGQFSLIDSVQTRVFVDSNLQNGRSYSYRIAAEDTSHFEGGRSEVITGMPNLYAVIINNGSLTTAVRTVDLTLVAPSATSLMRISNTSDFAESNWEPFADTRQWLLTSEPGLKTVFVMYRDANGNSTGDAATATISYEVLSYQYSILASAGALRAYSRNIALSISAPQGTSFMKIATAASFAGAQWENYAASKSWLVDQQSGRNGDTLVFYARFQDQNHDSVAVEARDTILLAFADPVQLFPVYQASDQYQTISLRWSRSLSQDFAGYQVFRSRGSNAVDTLAANTTDISAITFIDSTRILSLPDTNPVSMYYMVRFHSTYGDSANSDTIRVILRNLPPPTISCFVSGINYTFDTTGVASVTAAVGWSRSEVTDFSHYVLYEGTSPSSNNARPAAYIYDAATLSQQISKNNTDTTTVYHYWLKVFDRGGQSSAFSQPDSIYYR